MELNSWLCENMRHESGPKGSAKKGYPQEMIGIPGDSQRKRESGNLLVAIEWLEEFDREFEKSLQFRNARRTS